MYAKLFSQGRISNLQIKNRIVMPSMAVNLGGADGEVTEQMIRYYEARAQGGAGIIIVEAACIDTVNGNRSPGQINIDHPKYLTGLFNLTENIKRYGTRAFIQLFHPGRQTHLAFTGGEAVAPSVIPCPVMKAMPRALTTEEIQELIRKFVFSASLAAQAGFDGVELHAAHGYLINQFLSPHSNHRQDQYGGSLENRMRFLLEIVKEIRTKLPRLILSVRLNIDDFVPGGLGMDESVEVCRHLETNGVHVINCSCGTYESGLTSIEPASFEEGWRLYMARAVKQAVSIPVIAGGMIIRPQAAEEVISLGTADFVFLGRNLIADPQWPNKVRKGVINDIRPCIRCNTCIAANFKGLQVRCAVNPYAGRESAHNKNKPADSEKKAFVIGGGPAGMHAALSLRSYGYKVCLYEQQGELGGFMKVASVPTGKHLISGWRESLIRQIHQAGVEVHLNHSFEPQDLHSCQPDILVIAAGARSFVPSIEGSENPLCVEGIKLLNGEIKLNGQNIVIIGGGSTGCEIADYLNLEGKNITIIEKNTHLASDMERKNRRALLNRLKSAGVKEVVGAEVLSILSDGVKVHITSSQEEKINADHVVWAVGFKSNDEIVDRLQDFTGHLFVIGDAHQVGGFLEAVAQGEAVGTAAFLMD